MVKKSKKNNWLASKINFVNEDIWRVIEDEVSKPRYHLYNVIKIVTLTTKNFIHDRLAFNASALTYYTLLAIVPILALLFAIARGFGFSNIMESQIRAAMGGQKMAIDFILPFIDSYLSHTKQGVFIGVGLVLLFWTIILLINSMEKNFNQIWQVKKERSIFRKFTDYFSIFLLLPILLVVSGGLSIFMSTMLKYMIDFQVMAPIMKFTVQTIPYLYTGLMFTALYVFMPNTHVKLSKAIIPGFAAGCAFQLMQFFYINSQLWVSRYNAIYGSFAALPLFLLWTHVAWIICLFGAELSYASQNVQQYDFAKDTDNMSRHYHDFLCLVIMSLICKRFERGEKPYSAAEIAKENRIPLRMATQILYDLMDAKLLYAMSNDDKSETTVFSPTEDINRMSVGYLIIKLEHMGTNESKMEINKRFSHEWQVLENARDEYYSNTCKILLKDL